MQLYLLILTKREYATAFDRFVIHKRQLGFRVEFAFTDNEEFSTFSKFKEFVRQKNPYHKEPFINNPFFLLIGGRDNYYNMDTSTGDFQYAQCSTIAEKNLYCTVGRFPGETPDEIFSMCETVEEYEKQAVRPLSVLSLGATKDHRTNWMKKFPENPCIDTSSSQISKIFILTEIGSGNYEFVNFMGHGGHFCIRLRGDCLIEEENLPISSRPPHFAAWACNTGRLSSSLGSKCILYKKAITFWGARGLTTGDPNRDLLNLFWQMILNEETRQCKCIGEVYFDAMCKLLEQYYAHPTSPNVINTFKYSLFGDPTLKIAYGNRSII